MSARIGSSNKCSEELRVLVEEQAALRRVATLVARGAPPEKVFAAVIEEIGQLLPADYAALGRYDPDGTATVLAGWGSADFVPVGHRLMPGEQHLGRIVFETGRPARVDDYSDAPGPLGAALRERGVRSVAGTPIFGEGRLWGVIAAGSTREQSLPADTEARLASFTELVATAIANTESRAGLTRLAEEQAALRRVATLVARGVPATEIFSAVADEARRLVGAHDGAVVGFEPNGDEIVLTLSGAHAEKQLAAMAEGPLGRRSGPHEYKATTAVWRTGRSARVDADLWSGASGPVADFMRQIGVNSMVASPIIVQGSCWGALVVSTTVDPLPAETEQRLTGFTELVATAIANADSRAALAASRARIVAASDETRRRIERDLHDGTQQQLVSLMLELRAAQATQPAEVGELVAQLARTEQGLLGVLDDLREISRGIHPAILSRGGLEPALRALARRSAVPVELDVRVGRLPEHIEVAVYYVVSEALTNAAKHAHASIVNVDLEAPNSVVRLAIRDDGVGGADLGRGSGLMGLCDRIEALCGSFRVESPTGNGTKLLTEIPLGDRGGAVSRL